MAALNFCHELCLEKEKNHQYSGDHATKWIKMLQRTIEAALIEHGQYENPGKRRNSPNRTEF